MQNSYSDFLSNKKFDAKSYGIDPAEPHPMLFPFQRACVQWGIKKGRAAFFHDCGLGKTLQGIEWIRQMPGEGIVVSPLNVARQMIAEAARVGVELNFCRSGEAVKEGVLTLG